MPSRRVVAVEGAVHRVLTQAGDAIDYGSLVWAAGGTPRRLACPGHDLRGVHAIRTRADVDQLIAELPATSRVVVIGGGYIGLEAAAVLTKLGRHVTLLEALPRVLARVAGEPLSRFYEGEHRRHGVDIRLNARVDCIVGDGERATGVRLVDGTILPCQMVIVGIGIEPAVQPLLMAGAEGGDGVRVDARCRASLPDVFAIGDCALHHNRYADGAEIRLESVQNANDQAVIVAKALTNGEASYDAAPWFWSNQFDLKLQTVGLSAGHDAHVVRGNPEDRCFSVIYLKAGRVIALDCVNCVRDYVQGRALVVGRSVVEPRLLANLAIPLKEVAAQAS